MQKLIYMPMQHLFISIFLSLLLSFSPTQNPLSSSLYLFWLLFLPHSISKMPFTITITLHSCQASFRNMPSSKENISELPLLLSSCYLHHCLHSLDQLCFFHTTVFVQIIIIILFQFLNIYTIHIYHIKYDINFSYKIQKQNFTNRYINEDFVSCD